MLINGQLAQGNLPGILKQLAQLPSSFPNYNSRNIDSAKVNADFKAQKFYGDKARHNGKFKEAIGFYKKAIDGALTNKDYPVAESSYYYMAYSLRDNNKLEEYKKEQLTNLQTSLAKGDQETELAARLALGGIYRAHSRFETPDSYINREKAIEHYSKSFLLMQGKVDYAAHRVEQGEVAFSNEEKLGTDNIQQCVAVILHDPITKKTALAHVDKSTNIKSLNPVIEKFGKNKFGENIKLDAYLVGGRDRYYDRNYNGRNISDSNIKKVLEALNSKENINIKSADIGDKGAPSGIVFDPITAKLTHAVPGRYDKTTFLRKTLPLLDGAKDLRNAFDFTESKAIPKPEITDSQQIGLLQKYFNLRGYRASSESAKVNLLSEPLSKEANEILLSNFNIIKSCFKDYIDSAIQQSDILHGSEKENKLRKDLTERSGELISDIKNNNISIQEAKKTIDKESSDKIAVILAANNLKQNLDQDIKNELAAATQKSRFTKIREGISKFFTKRRNNIIEAKENNTTLTQIVKNDSNISTFTYESQDNKMDKKISSRFKTARKKLEEQPNQVVFNAPRDC